MAAEGEGGTGALPVAPFGAAGDAVGDDVWPI